MLLAVGWLPMILMSASILRSYRDRAISVRSTEVQNQCKILSNQLLSYNYMEDPSTELIDGELYVAGERFVSDATTTQALCDAFGIAYQ